LLEDVKAASLVVVGIAGDGCVLCTASDAHIRQRKVVVPRDCMASIPMSATTTRSATCANR
jgi:nicotinamidase-related amidase